MKKILSLVLALALGVPSSGLSQLIEYYHLDGLGNVRAVTDESGRVVERHEYLPFGEEWNPQPGGQPLRLTGKERDAETGLDYFGARYYASPLGRFTTIDPVYTWEENLLDPQRWNRYAYVRNNPLRYVDPDGRAVETVWDVINLALGIGSLAGNVAAGNFGAAAVDAGGVFLDLAAGVIPGVPGGAASAIKAARTADTSAAGLLKANRAAGKAAEVKVAQELIAEGRVIEGSQVCCKTPIGRRIIDHLVRDPDGAVTAIEVKSGRATRTGLQRAKDVEIAAGRGRFVGKNAPSELRGQTKAVETFERKPLK